MHIDTDYSLIPPYSLMIILSFACGETAWAFLNRKAEVSKPIAKYLLFLAPPMSLFCAVLLTLIESKGKTIGLSSLGALAGMYAASLTMGLISDDCADLRKMSRNCVLILPLMYAIGKIGCLLAGCCRGIPYSGVLCISYTGRNACDHTLFPVQLCETAAFLVLFAVGSLLYLRGFRLAVPLVFTGAGGIKLALDFLRESHIGIIFSFTQALCAVLVLIGVVWTALAIRKTRPV